MQVVVGIDIGGTKCAVSFAKQHSDDIEFLDKVRMKTETESFDRAMESFIRIIREKFSQNPDWQLMSIGISCGGPLDAEKGLILSPPNLLKWEKADVYTPCLLYTSFLCSMQEERNTAWLPERSRRG